MAAHIAERNDVAALQLQQDIDHAVSELPKHPYLYRIGRAPGTREMVVHPLSNQREQRRSPMSPPVTQLQAPINPSRRRWNARLTGCLALAMGSGFGFAAEPGLQETDRIRLAEAFRLSDRMGDSIWKGWNDVPFAVLLVTPAHEYLLRHPQPSAEFVKLGHDELLKSDIYWRPRQFPVNLLAAFPAVSGISTAVVGQAQYTETPNSTEWVIALLHEHFHQMQSTQPDYYEGVDRLEIDPSDKTGKWMLQFPFPYSAPPVVERVARLAQALRTPGVTVPDYAALRRDLQRALPQPAARYFGFQLWQEGIARYVQIRFAEQAASHYRPTAAFSSLPDFRSFASCAQALAQRRARYLDNPDLAEAKRLLLYEIGAAEGLLLDRTVPGWNDSYFSQPFDTAPYFVAHGI